MWAVAIYYIYGIAHLYYVAFKNVSFFNELSFRGQALVYNQYFIVTQKLVHYNTQFTAIGPL